MSDPVRRVVPGGKDRGGSVEEIGNGATTKGAKSTEGVIFSGKLLKLRQNAVYYRLGYAMVVGLVLGTAVATPNTWLDDKDPSMRRKVALHLSMLLILCVGLYWAIQGSNPGYIMVNQHTEIELSAPQGSKTEASSTTFEQTIHAAKDSRDDSDVTVQMLGNTSDTDSFDSSDEEEGEDSFELDILPHESYDARLAHVSVSDVPARAKFCRNSHMHVAKFDHFCGVLGTCIGERNHCLFWWFLMVHTGTLIYLVRLVFSGFRDTEAKMGTWLDHNGHALGTVIFLWIFLLPVGLLFLFHTFLALSSMTSYEFLSSDRIHYLKGTRDFDLPFSRGLYNNLKQFCWLDGLRLALFPLSEWTPRKWELLITDRDSEDVWNNIWENRYWSCC
mmetsp:Transcript_17767/g.32753  ORF Transcript_17767/g.32753 Transcript_17767/m.32753 type:complete len:388 (+) Transcript_17767:358-1521(+)